MDIASYIIHLERAVDRKDNVEQLAKQLPGRVVVVDAVDGNELDDASINSIYRQRTHKPSYPFDLRRSEIACFMSYRKAWQALIDSEDDYCLIVEDDIVFEELQFVIALKLALESASRNSYIRFPIKNREAVGTLLGSSGQVKHYSPDRIGLGMVMQIVGRDAAKRLIAASKVIDRPVDTLIQLNWITSVSPTVVFPNGVTEISHQLGGSTIGSKMAISEKIYRELLRPIYRFSLNIIRARAIKNEKTSQ